SGLVTSSLSLLLKQSVGDVLVLGSVTLGIAAVSALVSSSKWLSGILFSAPAGRLSDLYGRRVPYVVTTTLQGGVLLVLAGTSNPLMSVLSAVLFLVLTNVQKVFLDAALGDTTTANNRHSVAARYNSYQDLGAALGPLLGYGAAALSGFNRVYTMGALFLLVMTLVPVLNSRKISLRDSGSKRSV
ncbi:MAG: MFS transporter, partial [Limnochordia bacterium]|nr:MFS transporter [Limnochordia bacterium]